MSWQFAKIKNKVFVYKDGSINPVFTFERRKSDDRFAGHGMSFKTQVAIEKWVEREGHLHLLKAL